MSMTVFPASVPHDIGESLSVRQGKQDAAALPAAQTVSVATQAEHAEDEQAFQPDETQNAKAKSTSVHGRHPQRKPPSLETLRRMPPRKLNQLFGALNGHTGNEDKVEEEFSQAADDLLKQDWDQEQQLDDIAERRASDPLRRYLLLALAEQKLEAEEKAAEGEAREAVSARLAKLRAVIDRTLRAHGKRIRGGANTAEALQQFSALIDERDQLREIYYDTIVQGPTVRETFERLLKAFGPARFAQAIRTMRNAIVDDMRAPFPSANTILLEAYYTGLRDAHMIQSLIRSTEDLQKRVGPCALGTPDGVIEFLSQTLRYTEGPGNSRQLKLLCEAVVGKEEKDLAGDDRIRNAVRTFMLQAVPMELWSSPEIRDTVMTPKPVAANPAAAKP
jgi:type III secretion system YopN/LcrE/InvE/MxiC family regulator